MAYLIAAWLPFLLKAGKSFYVVKFLSFFKEIKIWQFFVLKDTHNASFHLFQGILSILLKDFKILFTNKVDNGMCIYLFLTWTKLSSVT